MKTEYQILESEIQSRRKNIAATKVAKDKNWMDGWIHGCPRETP